MLSKNKLIVIVGSLFVVAFVIMMFQSMKISNISREVEFLKGKTS